jgi:hypothetical protein
MTDLREALRRAGGAGPHEAVDHNAVAQKARRILKRRRAMYAVGTAAFLFVVGFSAFQIAEGNWFSRTSTHRLEETARQGGGPGEVTPPAKRPMKLEPIVVETPSAAEATEGLQSPITIAGTANVFEATVSVRILDDSGNIVGEGFTSATCGSGCRGDFALDLAFDVETSESGVIEVYSESAETGEPMHMVEVPVTLLPSSPAAEETVDGETEPAPITVDSHQVGDRMTAPSTIVSGTANTFEANVRIRLLGEDGDILVDTFTTATCGSGCRGDYSKRIKFNVDREQAGTLQVFEDSAETGEPINMVEIPVVLAPE